jgi:Flp pilus assembly protein TadD
MRIPARWWKLCLLTAFSLAVAAAQRTGGTPPGGASGNNPPGGASPLPSGNRGNQPGGIFDQPSQNERMERPVFLSGKVVLDDGTAPPEPVTIELMCHGQVRPEGYTDSRGRFSIQLGQQGATLMDASVSSGAMGNPGAPGRRDTFTSGPGSTPSSGGAMGITDLSACELRAVLPGFRSEMVMLGRRSVFDNPDVGTIILRRLANVQGTAISMTTLAAPKDARRSFEKAQTLLHQKPPKRQDAVKELEKAVQVYPAFAAAWNELGTLKLAADDQDGARTAFERSLAADPKYLNPYMQLAAINMRANQWEPAADLTQKLVTLNPFMPQAYYFNAVANFNLGKIDQAEKSARSALQGDEAKRLPYTHRLLGAILAKQGNFPTAAEEYRTFLKLSPSAPEADQLRRQLAEWEGLGVIPRTETASTASDNAKEQP